MLAGIACGHKHQHLLPAVLSDQVTQQACAAFFIYADGALRDVGLVAFKSFHCDAHRIAQQFGRERLHLGCKRGREQQGLAIGRQQRQHALQLFRETQVQQAVGFVQNQVLHIGQA